VTIQNKEMLYRRISKHIAENYFYEDHIFIQLVIERVHPLHLITRTCADTKATKDFTNINMNEDKLLARPQGAVNIVASYCIFFIFSVILRGRCYFNRANIPKHDVYEF
jgi:hypothetical protein